MVTLIIYDGNNYYHTTLNVQDNDRALKLIPRGHDLMFVIEDDVVVLDGSFDELDERAI